MPKEKLFKLIDILKYSSNLLENKGIKNSRLNVELMLAKVLNCNRMQLYLDYEKPMAPMEISEFKIYLKRRLNFEPVQYILGETEFCGNKFYLNRNVMIPRVDSEVLVEKVVEYIKLCDFNSIKILEIGTGSGCLSISICKFLLKGKIDCCIKATDKSEEALKLAEENAILNNISEKNIKFNQSDFLKMTEIGVEFDMVVMNPPYIPLNEIEKLDVEVKDFEPLESLTDNSDGLSFYRKMFSLAKEHHKPVCIFCEIGYNQKGLLESLMKEHSINKFEFFKDYNNIFRVLKIIT